MARYLLDTNVVLRLMDQAAQEHVICRQAVEFLTAEGHQPLLAPQVIYEFWVVSTRPAERNGFGWPVSKAAEAADRLLAAFTVIHETPEVFDNWRVLVERFDIKGKRAHDVRLAAFKETYGIPFLITLNGADFAGVADGVVAPGQVISQV